MIDFRSDRSEKAVTGPVWGCSGLALQRFQRFQYKNPQDLGTYVVDEVYSSDPA